jgi:hypothetical protein
MSKRGEIVVLEIKHGKKFRPEWIKGMVDFRSLSKENVKGSHVICTGKDRLQVNGVKIWPAAEFLTALFKAYFVGQYLIADIIIAKGRNGSDKHPPTMRHIPNNVRRFWLLSSKF